MSNIGGDESEWESSCISRCASNDPEERRRANCEYAIRYMGRLRSALLQLSVQPADADDAVQEAMMKALLKFEKAQFDQASSRDGSSWHWLLRIGINCVRDHQRGCAGRRTLRSNFRQLVELRQAHDCGTPDERLAVREAVMDAIEQLNDSEREAVEKILGRQMVEVSELDRLRPNFSKALRRLRTALIDAGVVYGHARKGKEEKHGG